MRYILVVILSLAFWSCDNSTSTVVSTGTAIVPDVVKYLTCSQGSVTVSVPSNSIPGTQPTLGKLPAGTEVKISGTINNSQGLCGLSSSVSFTCQGVVFVDTLRYIRCNQGGTIGSVSTSITALPSLTLGLPTQTPLTRNQNHTPSFLGGGIAVYDNGQRISVEIKVSQPYNLGACPIGWACSLGL